jgi:hypothetical protein
MRKLSSLIALLSIAGNILFFGGTKFFTISARCYYEGVLQGDLKWLKRKEFIDKLFEFFGQKNHCRESFFLALEFAQKITHRTRESGFFYGRK